MGCNYKVPRRAKFFFSHSCCSLNSAVHHNPWLSDGVTEPWILISGMTDEWIVCIGSRFMTILDEYDDYDAMTIIGNHSLQISTCNA